MIRFTLILLLFTVLSLTLSAKDGLTVTGGSDTPIELKGTGIESIYVLNSMANAQIKYESKKSTTKFYRYQNALSDKEQVLDADVTKTVHGVGANATYHYEVANLQEDRGYLVDDGMTWAIWVIDYAAHQPVIHSIEPATDGLDCKEKMIRLLINKTDDLFYNDIYGARHRIPRLYDITYNTKEWKSNSNSFEPKVEKYENQDIATDLAVDAPFVDTEFTITGDQFAKEFKTPITAISSTYQALVSRAHIVHEKVDRDAENEIENKPGELDGSGPIEVNFFGYGNNTNDAYYTWFIYKLPDVRNYIARYTEQDISYEFNEAAVYKVLLEVADVNSMCVDSTSVQFKLTESKLDVPNYFSPGDSPGSNDEFRVAYRSLKTFKCTIFNRWGNKLYQWTDPSKGWDGKYKGTYVNPGVYFYVIEAEGIDGEKYKKGGDINILRSK